MGANEFKKANADYRHVRRFAHNWAVVDDVETKIVAAKLAMERRGDLFRLPGRRRTTCGHQAPEWHRMATPDRMSALVGEIDLIRRSGISSMNAIARELERRGVKTLRGYTRWTCAQVRWILNTAGRQSIYKAQREAFDRAAMAQIDVMRRDNPHISMRAIGEELTRRGVEPPGRSAGWDGNTVWRLLRRMSGASPHVAPDEQIAWCLEARFQCDGSLAIELAEADDDGDEPFTAEDLTGFLGVGPWRELLIGALEHLQPAGDVLVCLRLLVHVRRADMAPRMQREAELVLESFGL